MAFHTNHTTRITPFSNLGPIAHLPRITTLRGTAVTSDASYRYTGTLQTARLIREMSEFIFQNSDVDLLNIQQAVKEYLDLSIRDHLASHSEANADVATPKGAWISVRMTKAVKPGFFQRPWHRDGSHIPTRGLNSLYIVALLGNPIRVLSSDSSMLNSIRPSGSTLHMLDGEPLEPVNVGDIVRLMYGQPNSRLHSSGNNDKERIIILSTYGTADEIKSWSSESRRPYRD